MKTLILISAVLAIASVPAVAESKGLDGKLSVNFVETPLAFALNYVSKSTGVHVILDSTAEAAEKPVTVKLTEVTARAVLSGIATAAGLAWDERWGGVFVASKERLKMVPADALPIAASGEEKAEDEALRKRIATQTVTFRFDQAPVTDCLEYVRNIASMNIVVDDAILNSTRKLQFNGSVTNATVGNALSLILLPRGLTAEIRQSVVFVRKAGRRKPTPNPAPKVGVPAVLDETKLTVNFLKTPLEDACDYLSRKAKYPIHLDPHARWIRPSEERKVSVRVMKEVPVRTILDLITVTLRLDWDIRWGGVFVASPERLAALSKETRPGKPGSDAAEWEVALRKRLGAEKITFNFDNTSLGEVLTWIRDTKRLNVLIDPKAVKVAAKAQVALAVEDRPLREALTLLLLPRGFTFDLAHEVVVVRPAK